ncbi:EI24 domain-containing protein [Pontibacter locisalis]|uniref:EI24 domain-containing protein n=1 Tax=Pontibacter locisalis TaxID=1719035 RepID=A0ABW5IJZ0_9BACT
MIKNLKKSTTLSLLLGSPLLAEAQVETAVINPLLDNGPRFFICIVAGVLLAIGFQALLTMLSVASGISAIGNIREKAHKPSNNSHSTNSDSDDTPMVQKISSAFGIWTLVTVTISLFFASLLAVKLSLIGANFVGVTLGLVIWAAFFTTMMYLEVKAVTSLLGTLVGTALSGIRTSASALGGMFSSSSESEAKSVAKVSAQENAKAMRKELQKLFNKNDLDQKIDEYVTRLSPQDLDINKIKKELKDLITDIEIKEKTELGEEGVTKRMFLETASSTPNISKSDLKKLSGIFDQIKGIAKSEGDRTDKVEQAVEQFTPASRQDIDEFKKTVAEYLKATNKQELQPERIRQDIQAMLKDPKKAKSILQSKAGAVDHDTLVSILEQRGDLSHADAEKYAAYAEKALDFIKGHLGLGGDSQSSSGQGGSYSNTRIEPYPTADVYITEARADGNQNEERASRAKGRIREFLSELEQKKDYNLGRIQQDFMNLFSSAGDSHESLSYKLKNYNEEEMTRFLSNNTSIPHDKAHTIAAKAVEARDTVLAKANEVEHEIRMRLEQAKEGALIQAENTRKAAASAAWWLVATAVVSGIGSAIGGMIALDSWII